MKPVPKGTLISSLLLQHLREEGAWDESPSGGITTLQGTAGSVTAFCCPMGVWVVLGLAGKVVYSFGYVSSWWKPERTLMG